ncbi:hypothetical protein [Aurantimonas sp. VKM B-3413]|uniref:hypothetical protein n=1 Tax=Aurantimonas sp. VKM B-3413 TaxID=2779401 RepID=UPI001E483A78|nr:hypothetical protein [Aurantimonas sp. VKM B-3413]MCB8838533.1 hypothetical protein [Aurantimonas sp. VKM B-3413]
MNHRLTKLTAAAAFAVSLTAGAAFAQNAYSDWNTDNDAGVSQEEFNTAFDKGGVYDSWDTDDDGVLSKSEFDTGVYGAYDRDDSGAIEEPEFGDVGDDMGDGGLFDV